MAEQSLLGVFGPTPEQLQKLRAQQEQERSMFAARIGPSYSAGYGIGTLLGGVVGSVFGLEDPELKKARIVREAYNTVLEKNNGQVGDRAVFMDQLGYELGQRGLGDLAATAGIDAEQTRYEQTKRASELEDKEVNRAYKTYLIEQGKDIQERNNIQSAYNIGQGLKALSNANLPEDKFNAAYQSSINKLNELGIDTTPLTSAENPEEKLAGIDYLISLGTTQKTRSATDIAAQRADLQGRIFTYKQKSDELDRQLKREGLDEKTRQFYISEKNKMDRALVTATAADKRLGATLQGFEETNRRQMINDIDTTDQTKLDIKNLADEFNLPLVEATKAVKTYQAKVKDYLTAKDDSGQFLYTLSKAQDLAKQDIASAITQEGGILGFGKKGKLGKVKPNDKKIIKLD